MEFEFDAELWRWQGDAGWHFLDLPERVADEIEDSPIEHRGFGSVRVTVVVGSQEWSTSVFPSKDRGTFILPVKKQVRDRERLSAGDTVHVRLETQD